MDFSEEKHGRVTDSSFAPACDVNRIVRHYENTGIDPFVERKKLERFEEATTTSYEEAMRHKASLDSLFEEQPDHVRAAHADSSSWLREIDRLAAEKAPEKEPNHLPAEPPPEASSPSEEQEKVQ